MNDIENYQFQKFNQLMAFRVREVLLISSLYDAFILQEDGHLTEQVFLEYKELSLSSAPRFTHVTDHRAILEALEDPRFDLVLFVTRVPDLDISALARESKQRHAGRPVAVLAFNNADLERLLAFQQEPALDGVFTWTGDAKIMLAIVKTIEDKKNLDHDISAADLRWLLVIEDSIRHYSSFLTVLYPELMKQSQALFAEGKNRLQKLLKMRTRPKVILAYDYEQSMALIEQYRQNLLGIISDVGFYRRGAHDPRAGMKLIADLRDNGLELPVMLQSSDPQYEKEARKQNALFADKNSADLNQRLRQFLSEHLGFGPFVFRDRDGREVCRAHDTAEFQQCLAKVPVESLSYHAAHQHFSNWLMARSEFGLAQKLARLSFAEFENPERFRRFMIAELRSLHRSVQEGMIADFSRNTFETDSSFYRIGVGSLGGKARSIAFLNFLLATEKIRGRCAGMRTRLPQSFVLTTDAFDEFMVTNNLYEFAATCPYDGEITRRFLAGRLPAWAREDLRTIVERIRYPLAVRSSSLLEDNMMHPFAGIYRTVMVPNIDPDPTQRLNQLVLAIKYVYASTFFANAKAYVAGAAIRTEDEKMAVVIQKLVGQQYENRFYPHFAGVAQSYNYYPIEPQKPKDGVVQMVLGLGQMVVTGGAFVRFCPKYPKVLPQFASPREIAQNSQKQFYALDMESAFPVRAQRPQHNLMLCDIEDAEKDSTFTLAGSVYNVGDDIITESRNAPGPRVITFNNILKHQTIPLTEALTELLEFTSRGMGTEVEIEFACDMGDWGRPPPPNRSVREPILYPLQVRPIVTLDAVSVQPEQEYDFASIICRSEQALGHGRNTDIRDVVYVKPATFDPAHTPTIARAIGEINKRLLAENRGYVLIGPGRWGSNDHWLGIPVEWKEISGARIIIEASPQDYKVEPSQGTHFFHNMTSLGIGYFTIPPGATKQNNPAGGFVDWQWLDRCSAADESTFIRHVRLENPLAATIDGRRQIGVIALPASQREPDLPAPSLLK
jgi:hypothetical protein